MYRLIYQKPAHFLSAQMALVSTFFEMFIVLGMYNFSENTNVSKWECCFRKMSTHCGQQPHHIFLPCGQQKPKKNLNFMGQTWCCLRYAIVIIIGALSR